ncbi:MAG: hypothetical protein MUC69_09185, partial [Gemmatimonadales bacterium]|nr:hypothetical protein [Gemmatimonadales bacterium]
MAKLQRWIDLLAALLGRHAPVPLERLRESVPGYLAIERHESMRRTFERDKDELRAFGIPIVTKRDAAGEVLGYQLRPGDFYLPYLSAVATARPGSPRRVDRNGYKALPLLAFEADELEAIVEAAARLRRLDLPALDEHAASALRKLAFDLPLDATRPQAEAIVQEPAVPYAARASLADRLELLDDALRRQKRVVLSYETVATGAVT